ncbi:MAG: hypothetical protein V1861_00410 [Candidatus Micrarchaeota archaeon]
MIIMTDITVKKTLFTRSVEGTDKRGENACLIRAKTRVFSGFWKYEVMLDTPGETFRSSGHFLQVLQAIKQNPAMVEWLDLFRDVSRTVCETYGSATHFFSEDQMLVMAALKNEGMNIRRLSRVLSMDQKKVFEALTRLQSLDLASRNDFSDAEVAEKTYRLEQMGHMIHGLLMEDRKYAVMQAMVDIKMA